MRQRKKLLRRNHSTMDHMSVPHKDALCRIDDDSNVPSYVIEIRVAPEPNFLDVATRTHELHYTRHDFEFVSRLFAILDTESTGFVQRSIVEDFVSRRCPIFSKRDEDLRRLGLQNDTSDGPTFDEIWKSVLACSKTPVSEKQALCLGVEGWMVFCRFIALAQYLEAKRRFSARHLQQTMRHRNAPRGSEVVVVDVPPPAPPAALSPEQLASYEQTHGKTLPLPELDLDHSLLAVHDSRRRVSIRDRHYGGVAVTLFGSSSKNGGILQHSSSSNLEFVVSYHRGPLLDGSSSSIYDGEVVVRRSMADMRWLNDTFTSHKVLGGTLCGRILPPFPSASSGGVLSSHFPTEESFNTATLKSTTGGAINAAAAGVGRLRDVAKSFVSPLGSYLTGSSSSELSQGSSGRRDDASAGISASSCSHANNKKVSKAKRNLSLALPESYYNPNSPMGKARQLERYMNFLLEHPALSTSFPLNTILTASQSGLEAAKETLEECNRTSKELRDQTPHLDDGKLGISLSPNSPSFAWVRTAAQAAMALQVHGMLETTGMQSASARLQHASLPVLQARHPGWDELDGSPDHSDSNFRRQEHDNFSTREGSNFEEGVINDDGYDLLPLPVPAPERRILTLGNDTQSAVGSLPGEERFYYGSGDVDLHYPVSVEEEVGSAFLGDIAVDENIDKLREVIASVDNTLTRCLASIGGIGKARRERHALHGSIVRGLDSWAGMRGKFVSQRSLMRGFAGIDQGKEVFEESDLALIDDLSWQTALATSAVSAADDVRSAVRVSRTAANARAAASSAAFSAQSICEKGEFSTIDEARAAQTRASIAQSHAIHAAVVEHEAKTVKRRATLALAHDVKTWNVYRKRELLHSSIAFARSQHEATRRSVDAWSSLRDGFIGTPVNPSIIERRAAPQHPVSIAYASPFQSEANVDPGEASATIYESQSSGSGSGSNSPPTIVPVEHNVLGTWNEASPVLCSENPEVVEADAPRNPKEESIADPEFVLPFAETTRIPEDENEDLLCLGKQGEVGSNEGKAQVYSTFNDERLSASMQSLVDGLMNWGGGLEVEEDHLALPIGMATSIVLEENARGKC